jgi:hypothetical protein
MSFASTTQPLDFKYYLGASGVSNPTGSQLDWAPNSGYWQASSTQSAAFSAASVPQITNSFAPISCDFNGDGYSDILWYGGGGSKGSVIWLGSANGFVSHAVNIAGVFTKIVGADLNGDGYCDLVFYAAGPGGDVIWWGSANLVFSGQALSVGGIYQLYTGDFNGDGAADLFWYSPGSGNFFWFFNKGTHTLTSKQLTVGGPFHLAIGDFNGDARSDILFWNSGPTTPDVMWLGNANNTFTSVSENIAGAFTTAVTGDFNGDGFDDALFYASDTAPDAILLGKGSSPYFGAGPPTIINEPYTALITGDFDGDGTDDVVLYAAGAYPEKFWRGFAFPPQPLPCSGGGSGLPSVLVDTANRHVFATCGLADVAVLDPHGNVVGDLQSLPGANGLAMDSSVLYVGLSGHHTIARFDLATLNRLPDVDTTSFGDPMNIVVANGAVWWVNGATSWAKFDPVHGTITTKTVAAFGNLGADPSAPNQVLATNNNGNVVRVDVSSGSPSIAATSSAASCGISNFGPGGTTVLAPCSSGLSEFQTATLQTTGVNYATQSIKDVAVTAANGGWIAVSQTGSIDTGLALFRPGSASAVRVVAMQSPPSHGLALSADGKFAYVLVAGGSVHLQRITVHA